VCWISSSDQADRIKPSNGNTIRDDLLARHGTTDGDNCMIVEPLWDRLSPACDRERWLHMAATSTLHLRSRAGGLGLAKKKATLATAFFMGEAVGSDTCSLR